jgi:ribonuclease P protein component
VRASFVIGRLVRPADFERVLAAPAKARSAHFAVHHLAIRPSVARSPGIHGSSTDLSTGDSSFKEDPVDGWGGSDLWLGTVVPRRHARRSVTRSLLKRQIRAAVSRESRLPAGLWVVRLRAPFDRQQFISAASEALRRVARTELEALLADAARSPSPRTGRRR